MISSGAFKATAVTVTSLSDAVDLGEERLSRITMPAAWTAANLTFKVSDDGATYNDLYDELGSEVVVVASTSRTIAVDPAIFDDVRYIKVRSGTTGTPVSQAAARTVTLITRPIA